MGTNGYQPQWLFKAHPLRDSLYQELHNRPFPVVSGPLAVSHIAMLNENVTESEQHQVLCDLANQYSVNPPARNASCYYQDFGEFEIRWEKHTEFSTYTILMPVPSQGSYQPGFEQTALSLLPQRWLDSIPGEFLVGVHLLVHPKPEEPHSRENLKQYFEGQRLIGCETLDQLATVWTAFRLHNDGFSRVFVVDNGLNACQTGRLIRQILEIEAYRIMALLSMPAARELSSTVTLMDTELANIIRQISEIDKPDDERRLLKYLTALAGEVEKQRAQTNSRFEATKAYYKLVDNRLSYFNRSELEGIQSIPEFLERRFTPAIRTCESVQARLEDLSRRIGRAGELLSTRVDLTLEEQNQRLLGSMNKRSKMQLRLQQTVEGLSVAAISYYMVGLLKYMLAPLSKNIDPALASIIPAVSVPVIVVSVWFVTHRVKKQITKKTAPPS
ncbi:MAG: DUF3422 domain-containing protein [Pseudomonadales bacterium]|nr:DUF3422 domain-containing protein [Pseudomonadales bacterium]